MAYSKTLLFLGILFAVILVVSTEVSARELAETGQTQSVETDNVEDSKHEHKHGHEHEHKHKHEHGHGKPGHGGHKGHGDGETDANQN
ncbi:hypothetical protein F0562_010035 [Nyssa sinensis]|uniref:Phase-change related protein n=1 Tax=Nyssa sinensis TaxID=561372 RepID=A0A5J5A1G6_9ASTE|nr:hypothetical protein F0562_010035 [Nyssa sinensis]